MTIPLPNPLNPSAHPGTQDGRRPAPAAKPKAIAASTLLLLLTALAPLTPSAHAQPMRDRTPSPEPGAVDLDLAGQLELGILIDLISDRLGINIISTSAAETKKIHIRAPESIPDAACPYSPPWGLGGSAQ